MSFIMNHTFHGESHSSIATRSGTLTSDWFFLLVLLQDTGTWRAWHRATHVPDRTLFSDQNTHGCTDGRNCVGNSLVMSQKSPLCQSLDRNAALCVARWPARMSNCRDPAALFGRTRVRRHKEPLSWVFSAFICR